MLLLLVLFVGAAAGVAVYAVLKRLRGSAQAVDAAVAGDDRLMVPDPLRGASSYRRPGSSGRFFVDSIFIRSIVIASITLALLIPLAFVDDIVSERSALRRWAIEDIDGLWGRSQTISRPARVVPYLREH